MIDWPIEDWSIARDRINQWKDRGEKIVFTNGCFDLIHPGHLQILKAAKTFGDRLVVGLNSDESVARLKGPTRPVKDQNSRGAVLAALRAVDLVILFTEDTPLNLITSIWPDVIVKGGDYSEEQIIGGKEVVANGGLIRVVPLLKGYSTSRWINQVSN